MSRLVVELMRPYRRWLAIVFLAMLAEIATSLAAPWPLKLVIDDALGNHHLPHWLDWAHEYAGFSKHTLGLAMFAGAATLAIAVIGAVASYIDNYYTTSVGQWVERFAASHLRASAPAFAALLRPCQDRGVGVDHHQRRLHHPGFRIVLDARYRHRSPHHPVHGGADVLARLGLYADRRRLHAGAAGVRLSFQEGGEGGDAGGTRPAKRGAVDCAAGARCDPRHQGLRAAGPRACASGSRQSRHRRGSAARKEDQIPDVAAGRDCRGDLHGGRAVEGNVADCCRHHDRRRADRLSRLPQEVLQAGEGPRQHEQHDSADHGGARTHPERIQTILSADDVIKERPGAIDPGRVGGAITFDRVSFGYDRDDPVLHEVSFNIEPGQAVGIVGPTGSGKSTVLSLLPRFYDPTLGRVLIDGVDIADYKVAALRAQIGFVLQTVLFPGTIRENIAYGRPGATDEEIATAARIANADEFIGRMPRGYDTIVGEHGNTLSGGQRQRLAIARAVIRNSPILVLDEPTAALDAESEHLVIEALRRLMKGRTVIMIAHRLSTLIDADKIIVLKNGMVAEEGSHAGLIARGGIFAALHRIQFQHASAA